GKGDPFFLASRHQPLEHDQRHAQTEGNARCFPHDSKSSSGRILEGFLEFGPGISRVPAAAAARASRHPQRPLKGVDRKDSAPDEQIRRRPCPTVSSAQAAASRACFSQITFGLNAIPLISKGLFARTNCLKSCR